MPSARAWRASSILQLTLLRPRYDLALVYVFTKTIPWLRELLPMLICARERHDFRDPLDCSVASKVVTGTTSSRSQQPRVDIRILRARKS